MPEIQLPDWERVLRVNVTAPFLLAREVLPQMIARKQGRIINIASTSSSQGYLHQSAYCATNTRCSASPGLWRWRPDRTASTFTIYVPAAWTPTSSKAPISANGLKASR